MAKIKTLVIDSPHIGEISLDPRLVVSLDLKEGDYVGSLLWGKSKVVKMIKEDG